MILIYIIATTFAILIEIGVIAILTLPTIWSGGYALFIVGTIIVGLLSIWAIYALIQASLAEMKHYF